MRFLTVFSLYILCASCATTKSALSNKLNGTWIPERQEMAGIPLPKAVYKNQKLIIKDSTYTVIAESVDHGIVRLKDDKMDIFGKEGINAGMHFTGLYKLENGQLTVCYNLKGTVYPESFDTKGKLLYFLSVFNKEMTK
jgi:uncharacterized protein (TIGR03067 family)